MLISVNALEVASELAHEALIAEVRSPDYKGTPIHLDTDVYKNYTNGDYAYREEYQEIFNRHYEYYFDFLIEQSKEIS
jgi:hypothetical protein